MKKALIILGLAAGAFFMIYYVIASPAALFGVELQTGRPSAFTQGQITTPYVTIGSAKIFVEIAKDDVALRKGLSGRESLGPDQGMLFIFPKPDRYRFWMPDMRFPIDIIWIGADKKVAAITPDVPPESNPASPHFYRPPKPAQYVLEVKTGFAKNKNVKTGDAVIFYLDEKTGNP